MASYHLQINEDQRQLIMHGLTLLGSSPESAPLKDKPGKHYNTMQEELVCLIKMFGTLDLDEKASPGTLHGFCALS